MNLMEALYAAVATVHGQEAADHMRANPSTPARLTDEDRFDWERVQENKDIARWGEAR